jgi:transposase InsO family protein
MQPHMRRELVMDALRMAWFRRQPGKEARVILHSDRGSQYCSGDFQDLLASYGMRSSMSRKGNCWDNAPTESLWGSLKVGRLYGRRFQTTRAAKDEIIERFPGARLGQSDGIPCTASDTPLNRTSCVTSRTAKLGPAYARSSR